MPIRGRMAVMALGLAALATTSCPAVDSRLAGVRAERLTSVTRPAARIAQELSSDRGLFEPDIEALGQGASGDWPAPTPDQVAALEQEVVPVALSQALEEPADEDAPPTGAPRPYQPPLTRIDPDRALGSIARETLVMSRPSWRSKKIGYLRAGAVVRRSAKPEGTTGCENGWYQIAPEGYVCVGKTATLDLSHPIVVAARRRPDTEAPMPYVYGAARYPTPPFYTKVPTNREQHRVEQELDKHRSFHKARDWDGVTLGPIPEMLANGAPAFTWGGARHSPRSIYTGRALVKSGFAFLSFFESEGRAFGLSVDLDVMPLDRMKRVEPSEFEGLALSGDATLPVVFVRARGAFTYSGDPMRGVKASRELGYREAVPITGKRRRIAGVSWLETRKGEWIRDENLVRVNPMKKKPGWATPGRTWIEVSILHQTLVAYEGDKPVYVTLVSTGADGLGDPKETHSTVRGQFLIHTKHVTATMSGDEVGDEFDLRDVPYVQYFTEGYALHAAYWHDSFGKPRSHGCINLSPRDARWLFHWTDPPVPEGWHGAMSLHDGTLVYIHP